MKSLLKMKADPLLRYQAPRDTKSVTAFTLCRNFGASPEETEYLELRTHCGNPGCAGRGLKGCNRCKQVPGAIYTAV